MAWYAVQTVGIWTSPWTFTTTLPLTVTKVEPADGATQVEPYTSMYIQFSAPISVSTLADNIQVEPRITLTDVYTYYSRYDRSYYFGFSPQPSTTYTVTLKRDITDIWGVPLDAEQVIYFATGNRSPQITLAGVDRLGIYTPITDTAIYVRYLNISEIKAELYPVTPLELAQLMGRNSWSAWRDRSVPVAGQPIRTWSIPVDKPVDHGGLRRIVLNGGTAGSLPTGIYLVHVWAPEEQRADAWGFTRHLLVVADTNVTFKLAKREGMVWATDLATSRDVAGLPLEIVDDVNRSLGTDTTDRQGLAKVTWPIVHDTSGSLLAVVGQAGDHFGLALAGWNGKIDPWMFGLNTSFYGVSNPYRVYLYTEKPLYRPGQPFYFKGILRQDDDAHYTIDARQPYLDVQVLDAQERQVYNQRLPLTDFGTFSGTFTLDAEAGLGRYTIKAHVPITNPEVPLPIEWWYGREPYTYEGTFQVAEYRRPEFQVAVTPERSEVLQGEFITFTVQANYFFGGPVSDAPVKWSVLSRNYVFDRYHGPGRFVWTDATTAQATTDERPLASGEGHTDASGQLQISLPANLAEKVQSQVFSLEAAVTDLNDQESVSRAEVIVHQSTYYIGLSSEQAIGFAGRPLTVSLQTVDWQGVASGPHSLDVTLVKREWFNVQEQDRDGHVQWTWSFSHTAIMTTSLTTTAQGQAQVTFIPPEGGQYYVRASSADQAGRSVRASTWRWVSSHSFISWRRDNTDRIPLIADQASYQPGEIAHLQIQSPYQVGTTPPRALITVERGRM
ncbi:MAG: hypothetical protein HGB05_03135, partial [Chloroflexi bacterium]|nr:hypothetical protein [Chloroflexota bacterium]